MDLIEMGRWHAQHAASRDDTEDYVDCCTAQSSKEVTRTVEAAPLGPPRGGIAVLVEDDLTHTVSYMWRYPDGHLGSIRD